MPSGSSVLAYAAIIAAVSLVGGWIPTVLRPSHRRMELMLSFVAGAMLGVALLHMLPHAVMARLDSSVAAGADLHGHDLIQPIILWLLGGFLLMFFVERFFAFHHHEAAEEESVAAARIDQGGGTAHHAHGHDHDHHHELRASAHSPPGQPVNGTSRQRALTWTGAAVGLTVHSLIEGVALAASVAGESHGDGAAVAGVGTFLVIALHKPFDAMTLTTLMMAGRQSRPMQRLVNIAFSLVVPLGAVVFWLGLTRAAEGASAAILPAALAFSAGTFLCIALSDLLPELQFHRHDRFKLSAALLAGLAIAWGTAMFESQSHEHAGNDHSKPAAPHDHADDDDQSH